MNSNSCACNEMTTNSGLVALGLQPAIDLSDTLLLDPALFTNLRDFAFTARQKALLADFISGHSALVGAYENGQLPDKRSPEFAELRAFYETLKDAQFGDGKSSAFSGVVVLAKTDKLLSYLRTFVEMPEAETLKLRDNFADLFPSVAARIRDRQPPQPLSLTEDELNMFHNLRLCSQAKISPEVLCLLIPPLDEGENFFDPNTFLSLNASKSTFPLLAEFLRKSAPQAMNVMFGCDLNDADAALVRAFLAEFKRQSQPQLTAAELRLLKRRSMASANAAPQSQTTSTPLETEITLGAPKVSAPNGSVSSEPIPASSVPDPVPVTSVPDPVPVTSVPHPVPVTSIPDPVPVTSVPHPVPVTSIPDPVPVTSIPDPVPVTSVPEPSSVTSVPGPPPDEEIPSLAASQTSGPSTTGTLASYGAKEPEVASISRIDLENSETFRQSCLPQAYRYFEDLKEEYPAYRHFIDQWLKQKPELMVTLDLNLPLSAQQQADVDLMVRRLKAAKMRGEDEMVELQTEISKQHLLPSHFDNLRKRFEGWPATLRVLDEFCEKLPAFSSQVAAENALIDRGQCSDVEKLLQDCLAASAISSHSSTRLDTSAAKDSNDALLDVEREFQRTEQREERCPISPKSVPAPADRSRSFPAMPRYYPDGHRDYTGKQRNKPNPYYATPRGDGPGARAYTLKRKEENKRKLDEKNRQRDAERAAKGLPPFVPPPKQAPLALLSIVPKPALPSASNLTAFFKKAAAAQDDEPQVMAHFQNVKGSQQQPEAHVETEASVARTDSEAEAKSSKYYSDGELEESDEEDSSSPGKFDPFWDAWRPSADVIDLIGKAVYTAVTRAQPPEKLPLFYRNVSENISTLALYQAEDRAVVEDMRRSVKHPTETVRLDAPELTFAMAYAAWRCNPYQKPELGANIRNVVFLLGETDLRHRNVPDLMAIIEGICDTAPKDVGLIFSLVPQRPGHSGEFRMKIVVFNERLTTLVSERSDRCRLVRFPGRLDPDGDERDRRDWERYFSSGQSGDRFSKAGIRTWANCLVDQIMDLDQKFHAPSQTETPDGCPQQQKCQPSSGTPSVASKPNYDQDGDTDDEIEPPQGQQAPKRPRPIPGGAGHWVERGRGPSSMARKKERNRRRKDSFHRRKAAEARAAEEASAMQQGNPISEVDKQEASTVSPIRTQCASSHCDDCASVKMELSNDSDSQTIPAMASVNGSSNSSTIGSTAEASGAGKKLTATIENAHELQIEDHILADDPDVRKKLYVSNLLASVDRDLMLEVFGRENLKDTILLADEERSDGSLRAVLTFNSPEQARQACEDFHGFTLDDGTCHSEMQIVPFIDHLREVYRSFETAISANKPNDDARQPVNALSVYEVKQEHDQVKLNGHHSNGLPAASKAIDTFCDWRPYMPVPWSRGSRHKKDRSLAMGTSWQLKPSLLYVAPSRLMGIGGILAGLSGAVSEESPRKRRRSDLPTSVNGTETGALSNQNGHVTSDNRPDGSADQHQSAPTASSSRRHPTSREPFAEGQSSSRRDSTSPRHRRGSSSRDHRRSTSRDRRASSSRDRRTSGSPGRGRNTFYRHRSSSRDQRESSSRDRRASSSHDRRRNTSRDHRGSSSRDRRNGSNQGKRTAKRPKHNPRAPSRLRNNFERSARHHAMMEAEQRAQAETVESVAGIDKGAPTAQPPAPAARMQGMLAGAQMMMLMQKMMSLFPTQMQQQMIGASTAQDAPTLSRQSRDPRCQPIETPGSSTAQSAPTVSGLSRDPRLQPIGTPGSMVASSVDAHAEQLHQLLSQLNSLSSSPMSSVLGTGLFR